MVAMFVLQNLLLSPLALLSLTVPLKDLEFVAHATTKLELEVYAESKDLPFPLIANLSSSLTQLVPIKTDVEMLLPLFLLLPVLENVWPNTVLLNPVQQLNASRVLSPIYFPALLNFLQECVLLGLEPLLVLDPLQLLMTVLHIL